MRDRILLLCALALIGGGKKEVLDDHSEFVRSRKEI